MRPWKNISWILVLIVGMEEPSWGQPIITTVAGGGVGDGGPATQARLWGPSGVFVDVQGNLFIVDRGNGRIRKVDGRGIITTVAGNGAEGIPAMAARLPTLVCPKQGAKDMQPKPLWLLPNGLWPITRSTI